MSWFAYHQAYHQIDLKLSWIVQIIEQAYSIKQTWNSEKEENSLPYYYTGVLPRGIPYRYQIGFY